MRRAKRFIALAVIAAMTLAACGAKESNPPAAEPEAETAVEEAAEETVEEEAAAAEETAEEEAAAVQEAPASKSYRQEEIMGYSFEVPVDWINMNFGSFIARLHTPDGSDVSVVNIVDFSPEQFPWEEFVPNYVDYINSVETLTINSYSPVEGAPHQAYSYEGTSENDGKQMVERGYILNVNDTAAFLIQYTASPENAEKYDLSEDIYHIVETIAPASGESGTAGTTETAETTQTSKSVHTESVKGCTFDVPDSWTVYENGDSVIAFNTPAGGIASVTLVPADLTSMTWEEFLERYVARMNEDERMSFDTYSPVTDANYNAYSFEGSVSTEDSTSTYAFYGYIMNIDDKCVVLIENIEPQDPAVDIREDLHYIVDTFDASGYTG